MDGPKFYGQSAFRGFSDHNPMIRQAFFPTPPFAVSPNHGDLWPSRDSFSNKPSRFENALHQEVHALATRRKAVEEKLKDVDQQQISEQEQSALMAEYSLLERAKEMLKHIVDQMQKCTDAIVANMR